MKRVIRLPSPAGPDALYERIAGEPYSFLLDSALPSARQGRYAFLGSRPFLVFTARGRAWRVDDGRTVRRGAGDPFAALARLLAGYRLEPVAGAPPLLAGAVGFASYEAGRLLERIPGGRPPPAGIPDLCFAFYASVLACDLVRGEAWVAPAGLRGPAPGEAAAAALAGAQAARAEAFTRLLATAASGGVPAPRAPFRLAGPLRSSLSREAYLAAVGTVQEAIGRGELYQANLTQTFSATWAGDPVELSRRLRAASPAPFAAALNFGNVRIASASPERFLRVFGGRAETRPIKGTRPRGDDAAADRALALELVRSAKDQAEHVMIVDLERNDLGRVCEPGSVRVAELAALERFPQVHHLTSTVEGRLARGRTAFDAFRALFPGGSITGAPKIRSEALLASLEPVPRGVYTGAIGYFAFTGGCDFSIAIRTITLAGRHVSFGVGGGVVADSDPAAEYEESLTKAGGLLAALGAGASAGDRRAVGSGTR